MVYLQNVSYTHPNGAFSFSDINLLLNPNEKIALIGQNGNGKSTLLRLIGGQLKPTSGNISIQTTPYLIPQHFGQFDECTVAEALNIDQKLHALDAILHGDPSEVHFEILADDWEIEERSLVTLRHWGLEDIGLHQKMNTLSGGQKTKIFLSGIEIHHPELILMDEPSNHLDEGGRQLLYDYLQSSKAAILVVSHDRNILQLTPQLLELSPLGIKAYGGNFDFYLEQKKISDQALDREIKSQQKMLRNAKEIQRETTQRKQKLDAQGKKKQQKEGLPTISMNTLKNNAEKSASRLKEAHVEKLDAINNELGQLKERFKETDLMKFKLDHSKLHFGKILITAKDLNFGYNDNFLWSTPLQFKIMSGERIAIKGSNGAGKTTLIKLMLGHLQASSGWIESAKISTIYFDQEYSIVNTSLTVYEQTITFNSGHLHEHEIKSHLSKFLFTKMDWEKPCTVLSGGEKMRLALCGLTLMNQAPDLIVMDEPTNNLDYQNVEILVNTMKEYKGTIIIISHDNHFLDQIKAEKFLELDSEKNSISFNHNDL